MHAIVNHLPIKPDTDWADLASKVSAFNASIDHPDFCGISMIRADNNNEAIILVLFANRASLDEVSGKLAGPWFAANMKAHLCGPTNRSVGEVGGGALASQC